MGIQRNQALGSLPAAAIMSRSWVVLRVEVQVLAVIPVLSAGEKRGF